MAIASDEILIQAINHSIRREILQLLRESPRSFSDILTYFDIATSKLTYHLKLLEGFIAKTPEGSYVLTSLGHRANTIMELIKEHMSNVAQTDQNLVKHAYNAQKTSSGHILVDFVDIGIVGVSMILLFWTGLFIFMCFDRTAPWFLYFILCGFIVAFACFLRHLVQMRKSASGFVQRIEDHLLTSKPE